MSVMQKLKSTGLDVELEELLSRFLAKEGDEEASQELKQAIDETGLKSPKTMKTVGFMQRNGKLKPGLYKELVALNKRLDEGASEEVSEEKPKAKSKAEPKQEASDSGATSGGSKVAEEEEQDNVVQLGENLSDKEEAKLQEKLRKEEERMRQRLLQREQKMRERMKARAEKRAQRQGMQLETLQAIKEKKDALAKIKEQQKELREESKKLRDEIRELKPKREPKAKAEGAEKKKSKKAAG